MVSFWKNHDESKYHCSKGNRRSTMFQGVGKIYIKIEVKIYNFYSRPYLEQRPRDQKS